jgi:hypothetical protein
VTSQRTAAETAVGVGGWVGVGGVLCRCGWVCAGARANVDMNKNKKMWVSLWVLEITIYLIECVTIAIHLIKYEWM